MMRGVASVAAAGMLASAAHAGVQVDVVITGQVVFNGIGAAPLSGVGGGQGVELTFSVDSSNFVEGAPGDTRGYVINQASFLLSFSGGVTQQLLNPFPAGQTPYFTLVEGFPVSDGFFVSTSPLSPGGVPLEQTPYNLGFSLGYVGSTLSSLNILDAAGTYDFTGLTSFSFNLWSIFPDNVAMDIDFQQMTITPAPATLAVFLVPALRRRRRRRC